MKLLSSRVSKINFYLTPCGKLEKKFHVLLTYLQIHLANRKQRSLCAFQKNLCFCRKFFHVVDSPISRGDFLHRLLETFALRFCADNPELRLPAGSFVF